MNKPKNFRENRNGSANHPKGTLMVSQTYEGQLPSPEMMAQYNQLDPTFANRILEMAEKEQAHQHKMDKKTSSGIIISMRLGMICAFLSVLVVSYLVYLCINKGFSTAASAIAVGVIVGIAGVFMYRNKKSSNSK